MTLEVVQGHQNFCCSIGRISLKFVLVSTIKTSLSVVHHLRGITSLVLSWWQEFATQSVVVKLVYFRPC